MNFDFKKALIGTAIILPAMSLSISNADSIETLIINGSVNFRVAPSKYSTQIDKLQKGEKVQYLGQSGNWYKVKYNGQTGYIYKTYASAYSTVEDQQVQEDTAVKYYKYVNATSLNFREGPSTNYSVISKLSKNDKVGIISIDNGWAKIKYNGSYGYVSNKYLSENKVETTSSSNTSTKSQKIATIISTAKSKLGCPYVRGSEGPSTFDCTGLTYYLYKQVGITIPRGTADQKNVGTYVAKKDLQPGDLVFLDTKGNDGIIDHGSIYIGNNTIIHANSVAGKVCTADLTTNYYKNAYVSARRVLD